MSRRSVLVILRCGDRSLHHGWCSENRVWDLAASYFGSNADLAFPEAKYVHRYKGGKWDGIFDFCRANPEVLEQYDYFWCPDDDIEADPETLDRFFKIVFENRFELAQPSLKVGSFVSHLITVHNKKFVFRNVNFVELMVPLLARDVFVKVLPLFQHAKTGFGIDFVWNQFTSDPSRAVAIVDDAQVIHTRAVGGALHKMVKETNSDTPQAEQVRFLAPYGDVHKVLISFGGLLKSGRRLRGQLDTTMIAAEGWLGSPSGNHGFTKEISSVRFAIWVVRNTLSSLLQKPNLQAIMPK